MTLELWRYDGPFPVYNDSNLWKSKHKVFSTNSIQGICPNRTGAAATVMHADLVPKCTDDLLFYYRNEDSPVWRDTLENQLTWPEMPAESKIDPLLHRTFGALVRGDPAGGATWATAASPCLPHCCKATDGCGSRCAHTESASCV